jgi:hypothetical protein
MAKELSEKNKAAFDEAVTHYAVKLNMDPLVIEKAYEGRGMMLVLREEHRDGYGAGAMLGGICTAFASAGTAISVVEEMKHFNNNGPADNLEIGGGLAVLGLLAVGACVWKRKKITNAVKADVERFSNNPQPLLPKPEAPKLI